MKQIAGTLLLAVVLSGAAASLLAADQANPGAMAMAAEDYVVTDLSPMNEAVGINAKGEVAGNVSKDSGELITHYLRSLGASTIEKATVAVRKETRGAVKEGQDGGPNSGDTCSGSHQSLDTTAPLASANDLTTPPMPLPGKPKQTYTAGQKLACSIEAMRNGGECEACQ